MNETIENLLTRNLLEVFGEPDAMKRRSSIGELWAEDGVFVHHGRHVGYAALNDTVTELRTKFPGFIFAPIGDPQAFHNVGRLAWSYGLVGEPLKITGLDIVTARNGRIATLYAFIDTPVTV
jgi:hypothetical protein